MRTLIVLLPLEPSGVLDYTLTSPDGRSLGTHDRAAPALLPRGAELVVVVPAQALSWHAIALPKGSLKHNAPRLRAVLDGLLEDRLLEEPAELHFALQPDAPSSGPVWVAACNRAWLRSHLAALEAAKLPAARIVPEFAPEGLGLHILGHPEQPLLAHTGPHGVSLLPLNAATLAMALAAHAEAPEVQAEPGVAALAEHLLQRPVQLQQSADRWLAAARSRWDLAQFDLSNSTRNRAWKGLAAQATVLLQAPQWRAARWGLALLLLAQLVGLNAWAWKESRSLQAQRAALAQTLTRTFPKVQLVVNPQVQMERELALLRQAAGATSPRDLEAMLAALGSTAPGGDSPDTAPIPSTAPLQLTALDYAPGEARLKGIPSDAQPALATALRSQGYSLRSEGNVAVLQTLASPTTAPVSASAP